MVLPDGTTITPENAGVVANAEYAESATEGKAFFAFRNPPTGEWAVDVPADQEYVLHVYTDNIAPAIDNLGTTGSGTVNISWTDDDPDSDAEIRLYYDTDNGGTDGVLIADGISEDADEDTYVWDAGDLPTGVYHVYATIDDGVNGKRSVYADAPVVLAQAGAPDAPSQLTASVAEGDLALQWQTPDGEALRYVVYYASRGGVGYASPSVNIGYVESGGGLTVAGEGLDVKGARQLRGRRASVAAGGAEYLLDVLEPGRTYQVAMTAVDSLYRESALSNVVEVALTSTTENNVPFILNQEFPSQVRVGETLTYVVEAFDADGDDLSYALTRAPEGMSVDAAGTIEWMAEASQVGRRAVAVRVSDPDAAADSVSFYLDVLDPATSEGLLAFNKGRYGPDDPVGYVELVDADLNASPTVADSNYVSLSSDSQPDGVQLLVRETQVSSGVFRGSFGFEGNEGGSGTTIAVSAGDTLRAIYDDAFPEVEITAVALYASPPTTNSDEGAELPREFSLGSPYPNPAQTVMSFAYELPEDAHVRVELYNVLGQRVAVLLDAARPAGSHTLVWDRQAHSGTFASGVYIYRIVARGSDRDWADSKRVLLVR